MTTEQRALISQTLNSFALKLYSRLGADKGEQTKLRGHENCDKYQVEGTGQSYE